MFRAHVYFLFKKNAIIYHGIFNATSFTHPPPQIKIRCQTVNEFV